MDCVEPVRNYIEGERKLGLFNKFSVCFLVDDYFIYSFKIHSLDHMTSFFLSSLILVKILGRLVTAGLTCNSSPPVVILNPLPYI